jgi:small conductance mechanosensitive channel
MPRQFRSRRDLNLERMFETRSDAWERVGLSIEVDERKVKRAQRQALLFLILFVGVDVGSKMLLNHTHAVACLKRHGCVTPPAQISLLQKWDVAWLSTPVQIVAVIAVVAFGWGLARAIGRFVGPTFMRRMDPATAGTFGFLVRLVTMGIALVVALSVAGVKYQTLAVGGAFTAVILGLAAQQTLGNVIAGMVLLSARPFRVGERVRLQAGAIGGAHDGVVSSLGLLYTTLSRGADQIMIPNNQVLAAVVVPLTEPDSVDVKVRLSSGVRPSQVQAILDQEISVTTSTAPSVLLEEVDGDDVVVRIHATPEMASEGAKLADQIIVALA